MFLAIDLTKYKILASASGFARIPMDKKYLLPTQTEFEMTSSQNSICIPNFRLTDKHPNKPTFTFIILV